MTASSSSKVVADGASKSTHKQTQQTQQTPKKKDAAPASTPVPAAVAASGDAAATPAGKPRIKQSAKKAAAVDAAPSPAPSAGTPTPTPASAKKAKAKAAKAAKTKQPEDSDVQMGDASTAAAAVDANAAEISAVEAPVAGSAKAQHKKKRQAAPATATATADAAVIATAAANAASAAAAKEATVHGEKLLLQAHGSMPLWRMQKQTGGRLNDCRAVFTPDSKSLICGNGSDVKLYSVVTGLTLNTLKLPASSEPRGFVTCILINARATNQVYVTYLNGTLALWNYESGAIVNSWEVGISLSRVMLDPLRKNLLYLLAHKVVDSTSEVTGQTIQQERGMVLRYDMTDRTSSIFFQSKRDDIQHFCLALEGTVLVAATKNAFYLVNISDRKDVRRFEVHDKIVSIAVNPAQPFIATGDSRGRIFLWYCFNLAPGQRPVSSMLHWHAHHVNDLSFTPDGTYLISGGEETVLVFWQLETGSKQFLPRLGSEISTISISDDQMFYAIGLKDNSVCLVSAADMSVKKTVAGVKCANVDLERYPLTAGLVVDPRSSAIALNGYPGTIQLYHAIKDQNIIEIEVSPRNRITRIEDREILWPHVHHVNFSDDGDWMATVDVRDDKEYGNETYLKFWRYIPDTRTYLVNTRVDSPHDGAVTALRIRPRRAGQPLIAVSAGEDKLFKVWELVEANTKDQQTAWICRSTGFYKSLVARDIAFSDDGSVMAIAFGSIVTLWDPLTSAQLAVLAYPRAAETIKFTRFIHGTPFLVAATETHIHVWNLVTATVSWSLAADVSHLDADPHASQFLVLMSNPDNEQNQVIALFSPKSPLPLLVHPLPTRCLGVTFAPGPIAHGSRIVYLDSDFKFQIFSKSAVHALTGAEGERIAEQQVAQKSLFTSIYGDSIYQPSVTPDEDKLKPKPKAPKAAPKAAAEVPTEETSVHSAKQAGKALGFLEAPSHIVAAPSKLLEPFMDQILQRRVTAVNVDESAGVTDSVQSMDVDGLDAGGADSAETPDGPSVDMSVTGASSVAFLDAFLTKLWVSAPAAAPAPAPAAKPRDTEPKALHGKPALDGAPAAAAAAPAPAPAAATPSKPKAASAGSTPASKEPKSAASKVLENAKAGSSAGATASAPATPGGNSGNSKKSKKRTLDAAQ